MRPGTAIAIGGGTVRLSIGRACLEIRARGRVHAALSRSSRDVRGGRIDDPRLRSFFAGGLDAELACRHRGLGRLLTSMRLEDRGEVRLHRPFTILEHVADLAVREPRAISESTSIWRALRVPARSRRCSRALRPRPPPPRAGAARGTYTRPPARAAARPAAPRCSRLRDEAEAPSSSTRASRRIVVAETIPREATGARRAAVAVPCGRPSRHVQVEQHELRIGMRPHQRERLCRVGASSNSASAESSETRRAGRAEDGVVVTHEDRKRHSEVAILAVSPPRDRWRLGYSGRWRARRGRYSTLDKCCCWSGSRSW